MNSRAHRATPRRKGFTLIELAVALVVSAVVLLGARAMAEQLESSAHRSSVAARRADRSANGERLLRDVIGRIEVSARDDRRFDGASTEARFESWCTVPAGWLERCSARLLLDSTNASGQATKSHQGAVLILTISTGNTIRLREGVTQGALWYIASPTDGARWYREWGDGITAPAAIAVVLDADTTLLRLGDRG